MDTDSEDTIEEVIIVNENEDRTASQAYHIQEALIAQPIVILNDIHPGDSIIVGENINDNLSNSDNSNTAPSSRVSSPLSEAAETEDTDAEIKESISKKRSRSESEKEDDGRICPICLDNWTNSGDHRICSLKCGHLFGHSCIKRWLESQFKKSCPTCKKKVAKNDIRFIYARHLIAVDTSELDELKMELDSVVEEKNKMQLELSKCICREHSLHQEIKHLKAQLNTFKNNPLLFSTSSSGNINISRSSASIVPSMKLYMEKSLEICSSGGCRVFDANSDLDMIMVNVKSPNSLFAGFGLRKICISQYKPLAFLPLHSSQIRDVSFQGNRVLTVSIDKSFKITDALSNSNICSSSQTSPLWSCCWDTMNSNYFYVGTQIGAVSKYDLRSPGVELNVLAVPGDMTPVVSVAHIASEPSGLPRDGIVSCKLNSLWFFQNMSSEYCGQPLAIDGPFYSMKFDSVNKQLLISSRPNQRNPNSRHTLANLTIVDDKVNANSVYTFESAGLQRHLSRSCFVKGRDEYVATHEESSKLITLWNIRSGMKATSVPVHDPVLDLSSFTRGSSNCLVGLTDKKMLFYKFVSES